MTIHPYPHEPNAPFYQQFHDPLRAYSNMNHMHASYLDHPERPRPSDLDHTQRAWDDAAEDWWTHHSPDCGIKFRGCAPDCSKAAYEAGHRAPEADTEGRNK